MSNKSLPSDAYYRELIEAGMREDDAGEVIDHSEILKMMASWSRELAPRSPESES